MFAATQVATSLLPQLQGALQPAVSSLKAALIALSADDQPLGPKVTQALSTATTQIGQELARCCRDLPRHVELTLRDHPEKLANLPAFLAETRVLLQDQIRAVVANRLGDVAREAEDTGIDARSGVETCKRAILETAAHHLSLAMDNIVDGTDPQHGMSISVFLASDEKATLTYHLGSRTVAPKQGETDSVSSAATVTVVSSPGTDTAPFRVAVGDVVAWRGASIRVAALATTGVIVV
ncbi:MAG: hypothetical protein H7338_04140, partial [Candidatus Sericytochromatia bacterium]|nr:hypothetical protein [Candidatus Sericytochromatia bacterium]